ncbi:tRNA:m(4)X modification enzyme TRM13 homolog [Antedon mediterranea]|uniref:tRNA:m(4)X modification enzyme TRM13 homolog n=1 Tax=Antedon mediterranea TaxID=105859 RepID=UPI003AF475C7
MAAPIEAGEERRCQYFVERKKRYCKLIPGIGKNYCGEHILFSSNVIEFSDRKRIPCPVDHKHTIYEDQLQKHLKKCNAKVKQNYVYYKKDINAGSGDDALEQSEVSISSMDQDHLNSIIFKVKKCHKDAKIMLRDEVLDHEVFREELDNSMNGISARKHLLQQSSLLGHLKKKKFLKNNTCFIEFGAGRGQLSHWLQKALSDSTDVKFILIDRGHNRRKLDCYHRNHGPKFERLNLDISDLDLASVPGIKDKSQPIVGISKHLCGAATDLALRCLITFNTDNNGSTSESKRDIPKEENVKVNDQEVNEPIAKRLCASSKDTPDKRQVSGTVFALCCHHRCNWKNYVGKEFFKEMGFSPEEFRVMTRLTSWAVCGTKKNDESDHLVNDTESHNQGNTSETAQTSLNSKQPMSKSDGMNAEERAEIGRQCKRLIDLGRVKYMQGHGFNVDLVYYIQQEISLENVVFIASKSVKT